jgi:hypothetical protein
MKFLGSGMKMVQQGITTISNIAKRNNNKIT